MIQVFDGDGVRPFTLLSLGGRDLCVVRWEGRSIPDEYLLIINDGVARWTTRIDDAMPFPGEYAARTYCTLAWGMGLPPEISFERKP